MTNLVLSVVMSNGLFAVTFATNYPVLHVERSHDNVRWSTVDSAWSIKDSGPVMVGWDFRTNAAQFFRARRKE